MPLEIKSTDRVTIAGLPGTGKTTLAKYFASLTEPKCLIYDPLSQYNGFSDECRYIPHSDSLQEFDGICRRLRATGNITFIIEEAERYVGQGKPLGENAFDLINRGRNWGVGVFCVTRRIQRLSKDFFDLCQHCFLFRIGLKSRGYIADMIGWEDTRKVMTLPLYHFLHYNVETEESSVHVLKLGAGAGKVITKEDEIKRQKEEDDIKKGRVEQREVQPQKEEDEQIQRPATSPAHSQLQ